MSSTVVRSPAAAGESKRPASSEARHSAAAAAAAAAVETKSDAAPSATVADAKAEKYQLWLHLNPFLPELVKLLIPSLNSPDQWQKAVDVPSFRIPYDEELAHCELRINATKTLSRAVWIDAAASAAASVLCENEGSDDVTAAVKVLNDIKDLPEDLIKAVEVLSTHKGTGESTIMAMKALCETMKPHKLAVLNVQIRFCLKDTCVQLLSTVIDALDDAAFASLEQINMLLQGSGEDSIMVFCRTKDLLLSSTSPTFPTHVSSKHICLDVLGRFEAMPFYKHCRSHDIVCSHFMSGMDNVLVAVCREAKNGNDYDEMLSYEKKKNPNPVWFVASYDPVDYSGYFKRALPSLSSYLYLERQKLDEHWHATVESARTPICAPSLKLATLDPLLDTLDLDARVIMQSEGPVVAEKLSFVTKLNFNMRQEVDARQLMKAMWKVSFLHDKFPFTHPKLVSLTIQCSATDMQEIQFGMCPELQTLRASGLSFRMPGKHFPKLEVFNAELSDDLQVQGIFPKLRRTALSDVHLKVDADFRALELHALAYEKTTGMSAITVGGGAMCPKVRLLTVGDRKLSLDAETGRHDDPTSNVTLAAESPVAVCLIGHYTDTLRASMEKKMHTGTRFIESEGEAFIVGHTGSRLTGHIQWQL